MNPRTLDKAAARARVCEKVYADLDALVDAQLAQASKPSTAVDDSAPQQIFRVTHPFHPLTGRAFELVAVRQTWGEYRVFYYDDTGTLAALPTTWTDVAAPDPFVTIGAGRAFCRVSDLRRLAAFIAEVTR